jgi:lipoate synthase
VQRALIEKPRAAPGGGPATGSALAQELLEAEVKAVEGIVKGPAETGAVEVKQQLAERVRSWAGVAVSVELLQGGLGRRVKALSKQAGAWLGVGEAAAEVVKAWRAQLSA